MTSVLTSVDTKRIIQIKNAFFRGGQADKPQTHRKRYTGYGGGGHGSQQEKHHTHQRRFNNGKVHRVQRSGAGSKEE